MNDMYQSPITTIQEEINRQIQIDFENQVMSAVLKVGVVVDKEELLRALQYDREQYQKGYDEGYLRGIDEFAEFCKGDIVCKTFGIRPCDIEYLAEKLKGGAGMSDFEKYMELKERACKLGIVDEIGGLSQLLHMVQFMNAEEESWKAHRKKMNEWKNNMVKDIERQLKEHEKTD